MIFKKRKVEPIFAIDDTKMWEKVAEARLAIQKAQLKTNIKSILVWYQIIDSELLCNDICDYIEREYVKKIIVQ
jgi:hypothetical protein